MKRFKVNVYICPEENTIDFKIENAVYIIGLTESVGVHLIPKYLSLLSDGVFYAIDAQEDQPRGVFKGVWEVDSYYDLDKVF